jgi:DNA-binding PadR family transcriptional regulator
LEVGSWELCFYYQIGNTPTTLDESKLSPNAVLILATLSDGYRHGYAIRREVEASTEGTVRLGVTTLYRLLRQLLEAGLVEESAKRPLPQFDNERRRYFSITPAGRRALRTELRKLERVVNAARAVSSKVRP